MLVCAAFLFPVRLSQILFLCSFVQYNSAGIGCENYVRPKIYLSVRDIRSARMRRDSVWKMSANADPNPAPSLASET